MPASTVDLMSLKVAARLHGEAYLLGGLAQAVEFVTRDRHLERRGEVEQRWPAELVLHACERLEPAAQRVDRGLLLVRPGTRLERDGQAPGVLAGVGRAGVEPVAGARDGIGQHDPGQRHRFLLGRGHRPVGLLERSAWREPKVSDELALGQLRYQLRAQARHERRRKQQDARRNRDDAAAVLQRPAQGGEIGALHRREPGLRRARREAEQPGHAVGDPAGDAALPGERAGDGAPDPARAAFGLGDHQFRLARRQHRHQRHRDHQRKQQREAHGERLVAEQLARDAGDEHHREEHGDGGERRCSDRGAHLAGAAGRGLDSRAAFLAMAHDVLEHHHRIVDQHADSKRDAAERHDVERQVEKVHEHEGADDRNRYREAGDDGRAGVAQEQVQDQDREQAADQRRLAHFADRRRDESGLVIDQLELAAARQRLGELFDALADPRGELHRVGVALLVDGELDGLASVDSRDRLAVLVAARHGRDIAQVDGPTLHVGDDCVRHLLHGREFVEGAHQEALGALLEAAAGEVDVLLAQALRHGVDGKVELGQLLLVHEDLDLVLEAAADLDRRGAVD